MLLSWFDTVEPPPITPPTGDPSVLLFLAIIGGIAAIVTAYMLGKRVDS